MAARPLRFGIKTSQQQSSYDLMLPCWREADELGFDTAWLFDHFTPIYRGTDLEASCDEGWTLLTALLSNTKRIRGGLMVAGNTYRHPALHGRMAATLDQICGGRLEVGIGAGWNEKEHAMYGWPLPPAGERIRMLDEACQLLKALWTNDISNFESPHYVLKDARCNPRPVQQPYPHLVVGASGERKTTRVAAIQADEWNWAGQDLEQYRVKAAAVEGHLSDIGRDPASLQRSVQIYLNFGETYRDAVKTIAVTSAEFVKLRVDHFVIVLPQPYSPADVKSIWQELVPAIHDAAGR